MRPESVQSTVCDLRSILRKTGIRWRGFRSRKIPEGVRFAAASLFHIRLSWLAHDGIRSRGSTHWLMLGEPPGFPRPLPLVRFADKVLRAAYPEGVHFRGRGRLSHQVAGP